MLGIFGLFFRKAEPTDNITFTKIIHTRNHEPLLEVNGRKIKGTKRCKFCGLNELYWERFKCFKNVL